MVCQLVIDSHKSLKQMCHQHVVDSHIADVEFISLDDTVHVIIMNARRLALLIGQMGCLTGIVNIGSN